jgi:hypothetical protein
MKISEAEEKVNVMVKKGFDPLTKACSLGEKLEREN